MWNARAWIIHMQATNELTYKKNIYMNGNGDYQFCTIDQ